MVNRVPISRVNQDVNPHSSWLRENGKDWRGSRESARLCLDCTHRRTILTVLAPCYFGLSTRTTTHEVSDTAEGGRRRGGKIYDSQRTQISF